jgi:hypothetical protein
VKRLLLYVYPIDAPSHGYWVEDTEAIRTHVKYSFKQKCDTHDHRGMSRTVDGEWITPKPLFTAKELARIAEEEHHNETPPPNQSRQQLED